MNASLGLRRLSLFAISAAAAAVLLHAPAQASSFTISDQTPTNLSGVSPFVMQSEAQNDRVFYGGGPGGWQMANCAPSGSCTSVGLPFSFGLDYTSVTLSDGSSRAYFVSMSPDGTKEITTAPVVYGAGIPALGAPTPLGLKSAPQQRAWGVPDSVVLPDGRVRLYWVDVDPTATRPVSTSIKPTGKQRACAAKKLGAAQLAKIAKGAKPTAAQVKKLTACGVNLSTVVGINSPEVIVSATSTDATGTSFIKDAGNRFTGGFVDSDVIQAKSGDWIALVSTGPGQPPQRLYAATSTDGLTWSVVAKPLTADNVNVLDPTAYQTGPNSWRLYFSQSPKATPFENHTIIGATLRR